MTWRASYFLDFKSNLIVVLACSLLGCLVWELFGIRNWLVALYFPTVKGRDFTCKNGIMPLPTFPIVYKGESKVHSSFLAVSSQVPSPIHVSKSPHGGTIPTFEPQIIHHNMVSSHWSHIFFMQKQSHDLCWEMGLTFCSTQLSAQGLISFIFKNVVPCRHLCHTWNLGLGTCVKW
jgi:hypothetical protein